RAVQRGTRSLIVRQLRTRLRRRATAASMDDPVMNESVLDAVASKPADAVQDAVVVRPDPSWSTADRLPHFVGVSANTADARMMLMGLVVIPPGAIAEPHIHPN